jgi:hypothetical protein
VLANRPDLLSQRGLARELAALTGVSLQRPAELGGAPALPDVVADPREARAAGVAVRIEDADGCPRYCAAVVRGVRVGPSPDWLVQRLAAWARGRSTTWWTRRTTRSTASASRCTPSTSPGWAAPPSWSGAPATASGSSRSTAPSAR